MKRYPVNPMARYVFITGGVVSSSEKELRPRHSELCYKHEVTGFG